MPSLFSSPKGRFAATMLAMIVLVVCTRACIASGGTTTELSLEQPFLQENEDAMNTMMTDMAVKPSGDIDADFAGMMIPHHRGAIDMAKAELKHGKNEQLRRIAQEIVVEQQQEIMAMHLALKDAKVNEAAAANCRSRSTNSAQKN